MKLISICCILWLVGLSACTEEAINLTCADPLGTDGITLKDQQYTCFQDKFNNCVWFRLQFNPPEIRSVLVVTGNEVASIYDAGEVSCLSNVNVKPTTGFLFATVAKLHHGYVIRMEDGSYARLFIDSWKMSGNQVTEVNITRQYEF